MINTISHYLSLSYGLFYFIINHIWNIIWFFFFCYHHLPCHILEIKHELKVLSWTISPRKWSWVRLSSTQNPTNQIFYMNYFMADFPKFSWRISTVHSLPNNSSCYQKRIQIESLHPLSTKNGATRNKAISRLTLTFSNHLIPTFTFTSTSMWRPTSVSKTTFAVLHNLLGPDLQSAGGKQIGHQDVCPNSRTMG